MSQPLHNKQILVTRPSDQSDNLCQLVKEMGGTPIAFPTMEIKAVEPKHIPDVAAYDYVIFISANAVKHAAEHLALDKIKRAACVGKRTQSELEAHHINTDLVPQQHYNSQGLLLLKEFTHIEAKRCLIVRGIGGKEVLKQELEKRGAQVDYFECYRRQIPEIDYQPLRYAFLNNDIDAVTSSSTQSLMNLLQICPTALSVPLVSISDDMTQKAKEWGHQAPIIQAENATDEAIICALTRFYGAE